jgi:nucleoside-triphosphatase THEP1
MANTFIDTLELSVRAGNLLRNNGISTAEQFLTITWPLVKSWKGGGQRTWFEILDLQKMVHREIKREEQQRRRETLPGRALIALRAINELLPELTEKGWFVRQDSRNGKYRLGRYVVTEDLDG